jgi:electron transfer flavoprotein alpha subunit
MVYAVVDWANGSIPAASEETILGAGLLSRGLRARLGVVAVTPGDVPAGDELDRLRRRLAAHGANALILTSAPGYRPLVVEPLVDRLAAVVGSTGARAWVMPGTVDWRTAAARLATRLDLPLAGEVVEFTAFDGAPPGGRGGVGIVRPVYGGNLMAREWLASPCILCVRAKAFVGQPGSPGAGPGSVAVTAVPGPVEAGGVAGSGSTSPVTVKVVEVFEESRGFPPLEDAEVIVSGGRGLGGPAGFELLERVASALGGAVGSSRAAVDAGWAPYERQVGQSGKTVGPRLYVALGISGAAQHLAGMRGARVVVAVNRNPDAPFFARCTYGVVCDWREFAEALLAELGGGQAGE